MATTRDQIFDLFKTRSFVKQDVFDRTREVFEEIKIVLQDITETYKSEVCSLDERVSVEYESQGEYEARIKFGGDVLIFHMHTNIFSFDKSSSIWNTSYVKADDRRAYCGIINVYNFLSDSFKYNRENDLGYLVSRLFVNKEKHFFVEGKDEMNTRFRDFVNGELNKKVLTEIVESAILYAIKFELYTPQFSQVQLTSVNQMLTLSQNQKIRTAKRLGFRMSFEKDQDKF